ncbi:MAG TPA: acetylornithine transaminase [Deltaproteobacteria bacterium]|nr:acetylornithine transaminase [Deltaproteobacteria bacterium]HOM29691.1 acetylornithine transaminase [Deltaproteobacteria bacterium]HPP80333.1 acetylornithine transaminase [Deltaproteobacteria bacterium]
MEHVMGTYARQPVRFVRGQGCRLYDESGRGYLDLVSGIAVCNLGHAHPEVVAAVKDQAEKLFHCSNLYEIPLQETVAKMLADNAFEAKVFFCNSGAEANEGAIKLVRRAARSRGKPKPRIITARESFHGRTLATLAATGQEKYRQGFDPIPEGFSTVPYGDIEALEASIDGDVGGVMLEPIQGEGGIRVPPGGYFEKVRRICDAAGILLVLDEVQTGMGRTGRFFAHQHEGITPDVMTLAKALGNGFPVGAVLARPELADVMTPGSHASTFGGNPLAMAAAHATLSVMLREDIPARAHELGEYLMERLNGLAPSHPSIVEVRGRGLMTGVEFSCDVSFLPAEGLRHGVLLNVIQGRVLRLTPPLVVSREEIDKGVEAIDAILGEKGL